MCYVAFPSHQSPIVLQLRLSQFFRDHRSIQLPVCTNPDFLFYARLIALRLYMVINPSIEQSTSSSLVKLIALLTLPEVAFQIFGSQLDWVSTPNSTCLNRLEPIQKNYDQNSYIDHPTSGGAMSVFTTLKMKGHVVTYNKACNIQIPAGF